MSEYISYFPTLTATTPEEISWETVTTTIRGDYLRQKTEQYRRALAEGGISCCVLVWLRSAPPVT